MNGFLLLLQVANHLLLFHLLPLEGLFFFPSLIEEVAFPSLSILQLYMLFFHLRLLGFQAFPLCALIGGIVAHKLKATVHLCKVFRREDKHDFVLYGVTARHVGHRLDVLLFALRQLRLQRLQLRLDDIYIPIQMMDVGLNAVDIFLSIVNRRVENHQILQPFLHIRLVGTQRSFLLLNLLLNLTALTFQSFDG